ncbi:MAG TPA: hypothetical protein VIO57_07455 [Chloroflexota bacterium]
MVDRAQRGALDLVPLQSIHPHELADPAREERIERRLAMDGVLRDPLIVGTVPRLDGYVLLDGTNRLQALKSLGLERGLVQVIDYSGAGTVSLRTWCHSTPMPFESLAARSARIPGVAVEPIAELGAADALAMHSTVAVLLGKDRIAALTRVEEYPHSRAEQLRALVDLYQHSMTRVDGDPTNIEELAQSMCESPSGELTLVAFPPITRSQVVTMAMRGVLIPAGITRHVILEGRALRVNVPLEMLRDTGSLDDAREALERHLSGLQPRLYREPTILYDS